MGSLNRSKHTQSLNRKSPNPKEEEGELKNLLVVA